MRHGPPLAVVHAGQSQPESAMRKTSMPFPFALDCGVNGNLRLPVERPFRAPNDEGPPTPPVTQSSTPILPILFTGELLGVFPRPACP